MSLKQNDIYNECIKESKEESMKKQFLKMPTAKVEISGELWSKINKIAKYMKTTPEYWIEDRLWGASSRFTHKV